MTHLAGHDRCQALLLPESLDDYVGAENPVRFIDAFVDELDLAAAGFDRVQAKVIGRPAMLPVIWLSFTSTVISTGSGPADGWKPKLTATLR